MGFRSLEETERSSSASTRSPGERSSGPDRERGDASPSRGEETPFGMELYRDGMDTKLQRLADSVGASTVRQWADEGMPADIMGTPSEMEAFRERQRQRPSEVPNDVERRNAKSVQRSKGAHHEASTAGDAQVPDSVRDVISSSGRSLDVSIQRAMEERMGDSFGDVRVHTGPKAAKACQDIAARAFTVGNHVAFDHGEYDPESPEGQHVLAHELAHVRQQTGGAVSMLPQADANLEIDPDPRLEREAEEAAQQAMKDGPVTINRMGTEVHVQRAANRGSMTYEGLDNLTEAVADIRDTVSQNQQEIQDAKSDLNVLGDEVHTGLGEKAAGIVAGGVGVGTIALGRAGMEPALQETLAETSMNPDLAAPALAASLVAVGVGAAGAGAKSLWDRAKERFSGDQTDRDEQFDGEESNGTLDSVRNLVG